MMGVTIKVTDDTPQAELEECLHHLCHSAKRCVPKVGDAEHPTGWDKSHERIDALLDDTGCGSLMANAVVARYEYAEGGAIAITVQVESSWPDGLDEARAQAVRGLRDAMAEGVEVEHGEGEVPDA